MECFSIDISSKFRQPDLLIDIHDWEYKHLPAGRFDIIAASVPCQMYSCARTRAVMPRDIAGANRNVQKVLDIVKHFKPTVFWIENPVSGLWVQRSMSSVTMHNDAVVAAPVCFLENAYKPALVVFHLFLPPDILLLSYKS